MPNLKCAQLFYKKFCDFSKFQYIQAAMAYIISKNHPEYFFLASYQMSPGVENKISTKKYFRGGQKFEKLKKLFKKHLLEILNLCNGLHYQ